MGQDIIVIGAGIGGLAAALQLSATGARVTVLEAAPGPGGKMRSLPSAAGPVDAGPTVLTLAPVFERLFAQAGAVLSDHVTLIPLPCLARHYWDDGTRLDLFADPGRNRAGIAQVFGTRAARQFDAFAARARRLFDAFDAPMMQAAAPSQAALAAAVLRRPRLLADMAPGRSLAGLAFSTLSEPKLAQLVARYATYVGGSPWAAPALLSLIWEAEARGVWAVAGGMNALARAIEALARAKGARFHYDCPVRRITLTDGRATGVETAQGRIPADAVLFNGDPRALATGLLGDAARGAVRKAAVAPRSLSAHVAAFAGRATGPDLAYHTVFFGQDPRAEFAALQAGRVPGDATLYICAQDRATGAAPALERFEIIRNAPPLSPMSGQQEPAPCPLQMTRRLADFGLTFDPAPTPAELTGPAGFDALFPASLGSLYGRSPKGLTAALKRPRARSLVPGLYLCGGGAHPGAGVPMAALSGRHAAEAIATDLAFTSTCRPTAMPGGMSTASRRTAGAPSR
ncbi:MAG: 1-hydroxycarotenoid 3,4-desaturase CrtD [Rhodobacteraceae bacterium HLUCCA08]|nr:MAG: 1-hydroxycarotenoid 3,4-desaturase CrtD [Rhodobacteraceae bacterium HLUCCA08]